MPLPLIGSLFSSKASSDSTSMSYPVQKSDDEWRAVLNKGNTSIHPPHTTSTTTTTSVAYAISIPILL
jgi:hypothetical protein